MSRSTDEAKRTSLQPADAACNGKARFNSHALAMEVETRSKRRSGLNRQAYRCGHCGGYHLGGGNSMARKKRLDQALAKAGEE